ncbi:MAG: hypothetical protein NTZ64_18645 [Polaromonas sp.]|nr:hypothetical protein [Polaromonas sp.]
MRAIFSIVSLLVVLAVVGMLAKKQLGTPVVPLNNPALNDSGLTLPVTSPGATPQAQSLQIEQQIKQKLDASTQPRPMPQE